MQMRNELCAQFDTCTAITPANPEPCGQNFDPRLPAERTCVVSLLWPHNRDQADKASRLAELALADRSAPAADLLAESRNILTGLADKRPADIHSLRADMALVSLGTIEKRTAGIEAITSEDVDAAYHGSAKVISKIIENKDNLTESDYYNLLSETAIFALVARQGEYIPFFGSSREEHGSTKYLNHDLAIFADGAKIPVQAKLTAKKGSILMKQHGVLPMRWSRIAKSALQQYQSYLYRNTALAPCPPIDNPNDVLETISHLLVADTQSCFPRKSSENLLLGAFSNSIRSWLREFKKHITSDSGEPLPLDDPQESFNRCTQEERDIAARGLIAQIKDQCSGETAIQFNVRPRKGRSTIRLHIGIGRDVDYDEIILASATAANIEELRSREEGDVFRSIDTPAEGTTAYYVLLRKAGELSFAQMSVTNAEDLLLRTPRHPTTVKKVANMLTSHKQGNWRPLP